MRPERGRVAAVPAPDEQADARQAPGGATTTTGAGR
jgi:hypothetical protein